MQLKVWLEEAEGNYNEVNIFENELPINKKTGNIFNSIITQRGITIKTFIT